MVVFRLFLQQGTEEYINDQKNGFVVDPRAENKVSKVILGFINSSNTDRDKLRNEAMNTAIQFSVRKAACSVYDLLADK